MKHPLIGEHYDKSATAIYNGAEIRKVGERYYVFGVGWNSLADAMDSIEKAFVRLSKSIKRNDNSPS